MMKVPATSLAACILLMIGSLARADELAKPFQVLAGDRPLDVGGIGYAAPFFGDFDMDGRRDLLVGQFREGKMRIFLNQGTNESPRFSEDYVWFQDGAETGRVPTG
jgi:hypothetical protein